MLHKCQKSNAQAKSTSRNLMNYYLSLLGTGIVLRVLFSFHTVFTWEKVKYLLACSWNPWEGGGEPSLFLIWDYHIFLILSHDRIFFFFMTQLLIRNMQSSTFTFGFLQCHDIYVATKIGLGHRTLDESHLI